jgi:hypothetical protein
MDSAKTRMKMENKCYCKFWNEMDSVKMLMERTKQTVHLPASKQ